MRRGNVAHPGRFLVAAAAGLFFLLQSPIAADASRPLQLGLTDNPTYLSPNATTRSTWFDQSAKAGADFVLLHAFWRDIAPANRTPGFNPANPIDPAYSWGTLDDAVRAASGTGLQVAINVTKAPDWAEGGHRPSVKKAPPGSWKPSPGDLRSFAHAIASRYSGRFPNLPQVRYWQLWSEPNLGVYLAPQWQHRKPFAPKHYRAMLNAYFDGIKSVSGRDRVLTGGTAPYGDLGKNGLRMPPAIFWRTLLCLKGERLRPVNCTHPAHFDIAAHNAIDDRSPTTKAANRDDISIPDLGKLKRILRKAAKTDRSLPAGHKPLWVTEFWWESKPPDPSGVQVRKQAHWLEQALYLFWKQGVSRAVWFEIRDQAPDPDIASTFQTGLFFHDGSAKPAYRAYRFPFVSSRSGHRQVRVWGKAPRAGRVAIQRKRRGGWRTLKNLKVRSDHIFVSKLGLRGGATLRAEQRGERSLTWHQG